MSAPTCQAHVFELHFDQDVRDGVCGMPLPCKEHTPTTTGTVWVDQATMDALYRAVGTTHPVYFAGQVESLRAHIARCRVAEKAVGHG